MNTIKSLILGSAAGLLAMGSAQAADLPVKAKAVEYVKVCSLYGAGYYYIPGTDTCIRVGGLLRAETTFVPGGTSGNPAYNGDPGLGDRYANAFYTRSRLQLEIDTRTATEYGIVRTFGQATFSSETLGTQTSNPTGLATNLGNNTTGVLNAAGGGDDSVLLAFLQFAGFTFGRSYSAFDSYWAGYPANFSNGLFGASSSGAAGVNNIQYTAQFGNGVSATIGLEDPSAQGRTSIYNLNIALGSTGTSSNAYAGVGVPDISGNVKIDQAWGLFQLSGQAHQVSASYNTLAGSNGGAALVPADTVAALTSSAASGHPSSVYGGAVAASLQLKNLPTGPGDDIKFTATYAKGDTKEVISGAGSSPSFLMLNGNTIGFGATTDGVYTPAGSTVGNGAFADGSIHLTTAIGLQGGYTHNWDPHWNTSVFGSQSWVKYDSSAAASYCSNYGASVAGQGVTYNCNPNYTVTEIGTRTQWTPVKDLTFSAEAMWFHLGTGFSGSATVSPGAPFAPAVYQFKGQNTAELQLRAQRNF